MPNRLKVRAGSYEASSKCFLLVSRANLVSRGGRQLCMLLLLFLVAYCVSLHSRDGVLELDGSLGGLGMCETEDPTMPAEETLEDKEDTEPEQGHWRTRSAVVSEPQLLSLAREVQVHCCGADVRPAAKRISISFVVIWVSAEHGYGLWSPPLCCIIYEK